MKNFVVLLGPPGAAKGTQAIALAKKLGLPHISSGNIFRENKQNQTELGILADGYIVRGELVPGEITNANDPRAFISFRLQSGRSPGWLSPQCCPGAGANRDVERS